MFGPVKEVLRGRRFSSDEEVIDSVCLLDELTLIPSSHGQIVMALMVLGRQNCCTAEP
jgi:hypothetical protein